MDISQVNTWYPKVFSCMVGVVFQDIQVKIFTYNKKKLDTDNSEYKSYIITEISFALEPGVLYKSILL